MPELLNDMINIALNKLSSEFVYRKLGLCYDYPTLNETFPLVTLPKAEETFNNLPNNNGMYTGMYDCILNNALLFDGYATRFEIGFETEQDEIIFDRLIGGTIRLGTVAPKNMIVRGLTGDGRYFYSDSDSDAAFLWAFTTWRTVNTTAVAVESQLKLINISSRWISKLHGKNYTLKEGAEPMDDEGILGKLKLSAILAICFKLLNNSTWEKEFLAKFPEDLTIPAEAAITDLLIAQLSLYVISEIFNEDEKIITITKRLMTDIGLKASSYITKYKDLDAKLQNIEINTDWREFKYSANEYTPTQKRLTNEAESVSAAVQAMYILLMSKDAELIKTHKDSMIQGIKSIPWNNLVLATSLSGIAAIHARGVEYRLWDEPLHEYTLSFAPEASLVADYLTEDYDEKHENKAGHIKAPKRKPVIEIPEEEKSSGNKKRRNRKRKTKASIASDNAQKQDKITVSDNKSADTVTESKKDGGSAQAKRSNIKNKRNRRRRQSQSKKPPQIKDN